MNDDDDKTSRQLAAQAGLHGMNACGGFLGCFAAPFIFLLVITILALLSRLFGLS